MHAALRDRGWIMKHMKINRLTRSHGQGRVSAAHGKQEDGCTVRTRWLEGNQMSRLLS